MLRLFLGHSIHRSNLDGSKVILRLFLGYKYQIVLRSNLGGSFCHTFCGSNLDLVLAMPDQPLLEYPETVSAALDLRDSDPALDKHADDEEEVDDEEFENLRPMY